MGGMSTTDRVNMLHWVHLHAFAPSHLFVLFIQTAILDAKWFCYMLGLHKNQLCNRFSHYIDYLSRILHVVYYFFINVSLFLYTVRHSGPLRRRL